MNTLALSRPRRGIAVNVSELLAFATLGALVLEPLLKSVAAAAFLLFGMLLFISKPARSINSLAQYWPLLLLPVYCLLSTLWSDFPGNTLRYGTQLAITLGVAIVIAGRMSPERLIRILFYLYSAGVVLCLVLGRNADGSAWLGIFSSKNAFAAFVAIFALLSIGIMLERTAPAWLRITGLLCTLLSLPLLLRAQSAGALATIGPAVLTTIAVMLLRLLTDLQKLFAVLMVLFLAIVIAFALLLYGDVLLNAFLETSGKDSTLTGRTDLWQAGLTLIAEKPLFGVGYRAFWVPGSGPAEQLWAMFGEPSGAGFNFHNTYISNAVELGLTGLTIEVAIIYVSAAVLAFLAVVNPTPTIATLLGMQTLLILRSLVEVEVFYEFSVRSILTYCTAVYAMTELARWRAAQDALVSPAMRSLRGAA